MGDIQCRELSKDFLRSFKRYLTKEDIEKPEKDGISKGEVILKRVETLFGNRKCKKKLIIVQNVIKKSYEMLIRGNDLTHSLTVENYEDE